MHDADYYKKLGFKCGLEIHQRLATRHKLFCSCSASGESEKEIAVVERMQRAVAGELGNIDRSTIFESEKKRKFIYKNFSGTSCLVDIDEEPPHEINLEAVDTAMLISAALNATTPDEIEPMRKGVVDGSDPSAFQRTMLVGYYGYINVDGRKLDIPTIFLEEESAGIEKNDEESATYNVSRLGIPLIEIDTNPDIRTPEEAKKAAMAIGLLLRLTFKVQRGIGTIRQDVNVSISGGARIEVKGLQEIDVADKIIENEVERQKNLIEIRKMLIERKAHVGNALDVTEIFRNTSSKIIKENISPSGKVYAARLGNFKGIIGMEINPLRRLGSEMSDYAKTAGVKGIIHSDEDMGVYRISDEEISLLSKALGIESNDAFVIVAAESEDKAKRAISLAIHRARLAMIGVPLETRVADSKNMITRFLRPLPSGSRMYPETDSTSIVVDQGKYAKIKSKAPKPELIKNELLKQLGNEQLAQQLLMSTKLATYNAIISSTKAKPIVVATVLLEKMKELSRGGLDMDSITDEVLISIFSQYSKGNITKQAIDEILKAAPKSANDVSSCIIKKNLKRITGAELKTLIASYNIKYKNRDEVIRDLMSKYRLNIDGEEINSML
jgi:glutamyl-tRNA(Gln) amidotransferase subunit E